jgi:hypothetical protein
MVYDCWWTRVFELKWPFFLDLSMVDRRLHDDLRKIHLHLKAPRFDLHRTPRTQHGDSDALPRPAAGAPLRRSARARRPLLPCAGTRIHIVEPFYKHSLPKSILPDHLGIAFAHGTHAMTIIVDSFTISSSSSYNMTQASR